MPSELPRQSIACPDCGGQLAAEAYEDSWFDDHFFTCEDCGAHFETEDIDDAVAA